MSLLANALKAEYVSRETVRNEVAARQAEADAIVKNIHNALEPDLAALLALNLKSDYDRTMPVEVDPRNATGLWLRLGDRVATTSHLYLRIEPGTAEDGPQAIIGVGSSGSYLTRGPWKYNAHTPPAELLERFFSVLRDYVADESLKREDA